MDMYTVIVWVLVMASTALMYRLHKNRRAVRTRLAAGNEQVISPISQDNQAHTEPQFRGFIIEPGKDCCQASSELQTITFSYRDTIPLPLPGCNKEVCTCERKLIRERRTWNRRNEPDRRTEIRFRITEEPVDRRMGKGRRQQDRIWSGGYTL